MGSVRAKKTGKGKKPLRSSQLRQLSGDDHLMQAQMAYYADDLDAARASFQRALDMEPDNVDFLDGYGAFLAECGPRAEAVAVLRRACNLQPDAGFEKYMYLGQVLDAEDRTSEAEAAMRRGVGILRASLAELQEEGGGYYVAEELPHVQQALCSALCSLAELLMNAAADAADETDGADGIDVSASPALEECDALLGEARSLWASSPEPLQAVCSLRRLQGRDEEALAALRQSMELWFFADGEDDGGTGADDAAEADADGGAERCVEGTIGGPNGGGAGEGGSGDDEGDPDTPPPSYEFRFEAAKLLLELDDTTEAAAAVLEGLLEENDGVPEVWLLLAVAHRAGGELEACAATAREGCALVKKLELPPYHEVVAALAELAEEFKGDDEGGKGCE